MRAPCCLLVLLACAKPAGPPPAMPERPADEESAPGGSGGSAPSRDFKFSETIPMRSRVIAISVPAAAARHAETEDHVDVFATLSGKDGRAVTALLLENVIVMAKDDDVDGRTALSLLVSDEDVAATLRAVGSRELTVALRNAKDVSVAAPDDVCRSVESGQIDEVLTKNRERRNIRVIDDMLRTTDPPRHR